MVGCFVSLSRLLQETPAPANDAGDTGNSRIEAAIASGDTISFCSMTILSIDSTSGIGIFLRRCLIGRCIRACLEVQS